VPFLLPARINGSEQLHSSPVLIQASPEDVVQQWMHCKGIVKAFRYPLGNLSDTWQLIAHLHADEFPNLNALVSLAVTHPVHSCDCERTFSVQNLTVTAL
jgi:hypothetical protein